MSDSTSYKVGYGKPPLHSRFAKGSSGFVGHRHAKRTSVSELIDQILEEKVEVSDSGQKKRMSKREVFLRQFLARAISGDRQTAKLLFDYLHKRSQDPANAASSSDTDEFLLAELMLLLEQPAKAVTDDAA